MKDLFSIQKKLTFNQGIVTYYSLPELEKKGYPKINRLPYSIKILLESALRNCDNYLIKEKDVAALANYDPSVKYEKEFAFIPTRVLMQDFTGVPAIVDLAAMRDAFQRLGGNPQKINPLIACDLVIDHSIQVDRFGTLDALNFNTQKEFERNLERYKFLKWGQKSFDNFRVVPPATGIVHQVNLEYLAKVVTTLIRGSDHLACPDTLVGTDSHTTMINGLGVVGWGVGGIEAEAVMLGQPIYMIAPQVVGFKLFGKLKEGITATDLVLTITQILRKHGVVDKFVEFFGPGLNHLSLPDRATIANMAPEYGATIGYFPIDDETLNYLEITGRGDLIDLVERYAKEQGLFKTNSSVDPLFSEILNLDLETVEPSLAGPKRPQDRVSISKIKNDFEKSLTLKIADRGYGLNQNDLKKSVPIPGYANPLAHGSIVIASLTSCTNTSNPTVMIGAGLLAKKALEKGLKVKPFIKTSFAPGSKVVSDYLENSGLLDCLEKLGFGIVAYGCTTCIGNSGPIDENISKIITDHGLIVASVLSGNRNFEGRVHPLTKANYLASPPLVVAYALAGTMDIDLTTEPLGKDQNGNPVYLKDIWPSQNEINQEIARALSKKLFEKEYGQVFKGSDEWNKITMEQSDLYPWDHSSTYIEEPPYFVNFSKEITPPQDIHNARVLVIAGDSVTTDHISPAGSISSKSPAGQYLISKGISPSDFNSYGARRGSHKVMMRGTFANTQFRNLLTPDKEGSQTIYFPTGELSSIYDAAMKYQASQISTIIIAGKDYGMGSSRDWAAKGPALLGVKAVIFQTVERIHRSNLIGMGILPLQFKPSENLKSLNLTGDEIYHIAGLQNLKPSQKINVIAQKNNEEIIKFQCLCRLDTEIEIEYFKNGGILSCVLRQLLKIENTQKTASYSKALN